MKLTLLLAASLFCGSPAVETVVMQDPPAGDKKQDPEKKPPTDKKQGDQKGTDKAEVKGDLVWHTDFEAALKLAKKEKKTVMVDFTGSDWCGYCVKLDKEVFSTPEFTEWAKKNVVLVELDFPKKKELPKELKAQNDELNKKYRVEGFPTILFLNSKGEELGRMVGFKPAAAFMEEAAKLAKKKK